MQDKEEIKLPWRIPDAPPPPRNAPCPCGSGRKYKKCHLPKDEAGEPCDNSFWESDDKGDYERNKTREMEFPV